MSIRSQFAPPDPRPDNCVRARCWGGLTAPQGAIGVGPCQVTASHIKLKSPSGSRLPVH